MKMDEYKNLIADKIKRAREERNFTQKQVANVLGLKTSNAISEIERGKVNISAADLFLLAEFFNKPLMYFFGYDFGNNEIEDMIAILEQLTQQEREELKQLAQEMGDIKVLAAEAETNPALNQDRKALEQVYNLLISRILIMSNKLEEANKVKDLLEVELGIKEK